MLSRVMERGYWNERLPSMVVSDLSEGKSIHNLRQ